MEVTLTYKLLTLSVLERACAVLGLDLEDILDGEPAQIESNRLTGDFVQTFLNEVLQEHIDLSALSTGDAEDVVQVALTGFFVDCVGRELAMASMLCFSLYNRYGMPTGGGGLLSIRDVIASFPPKRYMFLKTQMRLSELLIYMAGRARYNMEMEIQRKRHRG